MSGWKDWAIGEVVTESDFQSFVQDQVVQVYDDSTDRDNTLGTAVAEGMVAYLKDTDSTIVYDGTAWIAVGAGDITGVTAGTALTGGGVSGDVTLDVDISALATAHAGNALNANGELLDVDESAITVAQSQVTDLVSDLADKADASDFTGGTEGFTALSNGSSGLSYQPVSHNYIINGAFDIWQRGDGPFTADGYTADRFHVENFDGSLTRQTFTPADIEAVGFGDAKYFARFDSSGGTPFSRFEHRIEDVRTLAGQTVTFSFWAKADTARNFQILYRQNFAGGQNQNTVLIATQQIGTSWQRYAFTTTLDDISGATINEGSFLQVEIREGSDVAYTLDTWGWQLEAGSIATPFKRNANSIQGELAACQRYYCRIKSNRPFAFFGIGQVVNTDDKCLMGISLPTTMRATPSLSFSPISTFQDRAGQVSLSSFSVDTNTLSPNNATIDVKITSGNTGDVFTIIAQNTTDAFIEAKAEL